MLFGGLINFPGWHPFTNWLAHTLGEELAEPTSFNFLIAFLATGLALVALYFSWQVYRAATFEKGQPDPLKARLGGVFDWMADKWRVDEFYDWLIVRPYKRFAAFLADTIDWKFWHDWLHDSAIANSFRGFARFLANPVDLGLIDGIANGLAATASGLGRGLSFLQTGFVRNYALVTFLGVVIMLGYLVFSS